MAPDEIGDALEKLLTNAYWNHRVIRNRLRHAETETVTYHIHEVHYQRDGSTIGWTEGPVTPVGETAEELRREIQLFLSAFRFPILEEKETDEGPVLVPDDQ